MRLVLVIDVDSLGCFIWKSFKKDWKGFDLSIVTTSPNVKYLANLKDGSQVEVQRPALLPEPKFLESLMEPIVTAEILTPVDYIGNVMKICEEKEGNTNPLNIYLNQKCNLYMNYL